jgi:hypothetical protein
LSSIELSLASWTTAPQVISGMSTVSPSIVRVPRAMWGRIATAPVMAPECCRRHGARRELEVLRRQRSFTDGSGYTLLHARLMYCNTVNHHHAFIATFSSSPLGRYVHFPSLPFFSFRTKEGKLSWKRDQHITGFPHCIQSCAS